MAERRIVGLRTTLRLLAPVMTLACAPALQADSTDAESTQTIASLQQVAKELNAAVERFQKRLDDAIAQYDRGLRDTSGKRILGADAELAAGVSEIGRAAMRKFMAARMLAARGASYQPIAAGDADRVQELIAETRQRLEASDGLQRRLLVVSAADLESRTQSGWKEKHEQLRRARGAAEDAARKALLALPIDLPEGESPEERLDRAWDFLRPGGAPREDTAEDVRRGNRTQESKTEPENVAPPLPLRWTPYRRVTLVHDLGRRMALTDSGAEDAAGRRIFYQEEWIQRGMVVVRMRWRVGLDTKSGQHLLIKRYRPREYRAELDEVYPSDRDYLWYLEPPSEAGEPAKGEVELARDEVAQAREQVRAAAREFRGTIHQAVVRNSSQLDGGFSDELRERLFAIRGHLAGAAPVLYAEEKAIKAIEQAVGAFEKLEPLAAWANQLPEGSGLSAEWELLQQRSDDEIAAARDAIREARALLPPDTRAPSAKFPELQKDLIVRIYRRRAWKNSATEVSLLQEIWRAERPQPGGAGRVVRSVTLIWVDRTTGMQKVLAADARTYPLGPNNIVEQAFDQYGSQELPLEATLP